MLFTLGRNNGAYLPLILPQIGLLFQDLKHFTNNWKWSKLKSNFVSAFAKLRQTKHETQGITASNFLQFEYSKMLKAEIIGVCGVVDSNGLISANHGWP